MKKWVVWLWYLLFSCWVFPRIALGETYLVTSSENDGPGSLREAVAASNTTSGVQTIAFSVANSITVYSYILITSPVIIDGGGTTLGSSGFNILLLDTGSDGSVVRDLAIVGAKNQFYCGIYVQSSNNSICGCAIGTDWIGSSGRGNYYGVYISSDSHSNLVGGNRFGGDGNIISGNTSMGIYLRGDGNTICGNVIGLNPLQTAVLPNDRGVYLYNGASNNIGLPVEGWGNIIAGNVSEGIYISGGETNNTFLQNNYIGISDYDVPFGNNSGVYLGSGSFVGGMANPLMFQKNVISGNLTQDILIGSDANTITGNFIGTNHDGSSVVSGGEYKIRMVFGYKHNLIGT